MHARVSGCEDSYLCQPSEYSCLCSLLESVNSNIYQSISNLHPTRSLAIFSTPASYYSLCVRLSIWLAQASLPFHRSGSISQLSSAPSHEAALFFNLDLCNFERELCPVAAEHTAAIATGGS